MINVEHEIPKSYLLIGIILLGIISIINLTHTPRIWFDEGAHLHVPKNLVRYGVYADSSSEGFRYDGPTLGVGPTVMLPIAGVFKIFGIGLLQARLVIVGYLLCAVTAFFFLARFLSNARTALVATMLLVTSRGPDVLMFGRQVLGEVPGLFFMLAGLVLWFSKWRDGNNRHLVGAGILLGLSMITKYQNAIILVPTIVAAATIQGLWGRDLEWREYLIPLAAALGVFGLWQVVTLIYIQPDTFIENLNAIRESSSGAAFAFSTRLASISIRELLTAKIYFLTWIPAWLFVGISIFRKRDRNEQWLFLWLLVTWNLAWYMFSSIGWLRYAFPALSLLSIFIADFFSEITNDFSFALAEVVGPGTSPNLIVATSLFWLAVIVSVPLLVTLSEIFSPEENSAFQMAEYLRNNISEDELIETWEPEMGFLTDHNFHYPPNNLLNKAVHYIWIGGEPLTSSYKLRPSTLPDYLLVGEFATWVKLYDSDFIQKYATPVTVIGPYQLFQFGSDG